MKSIYLEVGLRAHALGPVVPHIDLSAFRIHLLWTYISACGGRKKISFPEVSAFCRKRWENKTKRWKSNKLTTCFSKSSKYRGRRRDWYLQRSLSSPSSRAQRAKTSRHGLLQRLVLGFRMRDRGLIPLAFGHNGVQAWYTSCTMMKIF